MSALNKQILNNFIVKNRPVIRKGKAHLANRLVRRSQELRNSKTDNDLKKNKNCRKADKLIEEIRMLRKFYDDDVTKYALLNTKTILEVSNDESATLEERALCRIATYKAVAPEIEKFRNQYPDWDKKVPQLLKTIGLQYRKKRLKKLDVRGEKETFLEKEHHSLCVLQQLTNLEVDRKLLSKASRMIEDSKKEENGVATERSKNKRKSQNQESTEQEGLEKTDSSSKEEESTKQIPNKKKKKEDKKLLKKKSKKDIVKVKNINSENKNSGTSSLEGEVNDKQENSPVENDTLSEGILKKPSPGSKRKIKQLAENVGSEDEGIAGDDSSADEMEEEEQREKGAMKEEIGESDDGKDSCTEETIDDGDISEEGSYNSDSDEDEHFVDGASSDDDDNDDDGSEDSEESDANISENDSEGDVKTGKEKTLSRSVVKKKDKKTKSTKLGGKSTKEDKDEVSEASDAEGSVDFDSEGSVIDENFVGEEVTSIWDDFKEKGKGKSRGKNSKSLLNSNDKFSGSDIIKSKGTVKIRRLNLADQKTVDELLEADSAGDPSGEEEEEDFFVRKPVAKKRKVTTKGVDGENDLEVKDNDESEEEEEGDESNEYRADPRERYIDKSFKKIWGKGMEETIQVSRGRRGIYRGRGGGRGFDGYSRGGGRGFDGHSRGGFERGRGRGSGGGRGRGFGQENANFLPLGDKLPLDQGFGAYRNNNNSRMESDSQPGRNFKQFSNNERFESNNRGRSSDRFARGGRGRGRGGDDRGRPGGRRGGFEGRGFDNSNSTPVMGNREDNFSPRGRGATQGSMLHPSWLAKQKEKEMASSIYNFKGQVKTFDLDD
ncbi:uncharacterized protein [Palaemon carinicauda]|uniref:uncharacterized protein n=1 Tax=Palaemon carinicauda TaxID=392227 RepID=UPI0035B58165